MIFINNMNKTIVYHPYLKKGAFSSIYKGKIDKKTAFFKIYNIKKTLLFIGKFSKNYLLTLKKISKFKITPNIIFIDYSGRS